MMETDGYPAHWAWMVFGTIALIVFSITAIWAVAWTVAIAMQHHIPRAGEREDVEYERRR
jgi:hypothetical protein